MLKRRQFGNSGYNSKVNKRLRKISAPCNLAITTKHTNHKMTEKNRNIEPGQDDAYAWDQLIFIAQYT